MRMIRTASCATTGSAVPAIKSFDTEGRVIYAGSFSKVLAAGLRVGFLCCADEIWAKMVSCKGNMDSGSNITSQLIASYYIEKFDLDEHIEKVRALYSVKCATMKESLDKYLAKGCTRTDPDRRYVYLGHAPRTMSTRRKSLRTRSMPASASSRRSLSRPTKTTPANPSGCASPLPPSTRSKKAASALAKSTKKHCK